MVPRGTGGGFDENAQDLLRHVRNMGERVERDLEHARDIEKRFESVSEDESMVSTHF